VKKLKICIVSSEVVPFAKTGGLADVSGALGKYLSNLGHDVRIVMPLYSSIYISLKDYHPVKQAQNLDIWFGSQKILYSVYQAKLPQSRAKVYFIHCPYFYNRGSIYTQDVDEFLRFALLNLATIELCQRLNWAPHVIHCNDWQCGLLPIYLKTSYAWVPLLKNTKTLLAIHNIGYQGIFQAHSVNDLNLNEYHHWFDANELYNGKINFLRTGIIHADRISTVSETYAKEIQTNFYGEGLQGSLLARSHDLVGILNGVDYDEWNPETDKSIPYRYSIRNLSGKTKNKKILLSRLGLHYDPKAAVISMVTRLVEQKGIELLKKTMEKVLHAHDVRFVVLGSGEHHYEQYLYYLQQTFPQKVVFYRGYNNELSHLMEAGADIFLMPSKYEPCGLNQIYSLKYGTVPIVRKTGGLADTVQEYNWQTREGTGFVFEHYAPEGLFWAIQHALNTFPNKKVWRKLMIEGMSKDFSWDHQIPQYIELYRNLINQ
jgi:starch synthase